MEINNVNGVNGVNNTPNTQKTKERQHDNTYHGEKVTIDTANPAELLGRSMLVTAKEKPHSESEELNAKIEQLKKDVCRNEFEEKFWNALIADDDIPREKILELLKDKSSSDDITGCDIVYRHILSCEKESEDDYGNIIPPIKISGDLKADILSKSNYNNCTYINSLYDSIYFPNEFIPLAVANCKDKYDYLNIDAIRKKLRKNQDLSMETVAGIMSVTTRDTDNFVNKMYDDKIILPEMIKDVFDENQVLAGAKEKETMYDLILEKGYDLKDNPKAMVDILASIRSNQDVIYATSVLDDCFNNSSISLDKAVTKIKANVSADSVINIGMTAKLNMLSGSANYKPNEKALAEYLFDLHQKQDISEIPKSERREILNKLISVNIGMFGISEEMAKEFPIIPRNQEEYCSLIPAIANSIGFETKQLTETQIADCNKNMSALSQSLAKLSDEDFSEMTVTQEYSKNDFIKDVLDKVKDIPENEKNKIFDYFGFELKQNSGNKEVGYSIIGYPHNIDNKEKSDKISSPETREIFEAVKNDVIKFTENNPVHCDNKEVETLLNEVIDALPELRTTIGKEQHGTHKFDIFKHSLKVMKKIAQDPKFEKLSESDKKVMLLASLLHDITKTEGQIDEVHAIEGGFDAHYIAKKFNLSKDETRKLYSLCKNHEWLKTVNYPPTNDFQEINKRCRSVAYDMRYDNVFDMAEIFTHADLKSVVENDSFHDDTGYGYVANIYAKEIRKNIAEFQQNQPILPTTKVPQSSRIKESITHVNTDGSTDIKGVYVNKDGLVILKYNEIEDWEKIGFPKGSASKGIETKVTDNDGNESKINTGNIKFFVHGLKYPTQLAALNEPQLVDSNTLLSISYTDCPETRYHFYDRQGVILDIDTANIHGGGYKSACSGFGKTVSNFKKSCILNDGIQSGWTTATMIDSQERFVISELVKKATGMNDKQYAEFVKNNENKSFSEIEPAEYRDTIIKEYTKLKNEKSSDVKFDYNEIYISNPEKISAVFAYAEDDHVGQAVDFVEKEQERLGHLQKYAIKNDVPMVVFGD